MKNHSKSDSYEPVQKFLTLGGDPVIDFCNTIIGHGERTEERFATALEVSSFWMFFFNFEVVLTKSQFEEILKLRSELRSLFQAITDSGRVEAMTQTLNRTLSKHSFVYELQAPTNRENGVVAMRPVPSGHQYLSPLILELHRFLNSLQPLRLKKCSNQNCSHFFYDVSKNNTRVWCSMKTCGNIMKARAFQSRKKHRD